MRKRAAKSALGSAADGLLETANGEGAVSPGDHIGITGPVGAAILSTMSGPQREVPPIPRQRKQKALAQPVDIPQELLDSPQRMNYVLLLALLAKTKGQAEFTQADLDIADGEYNVMFAKSLEGDKVVVSVVSVQSGILSAPNSRPKQEEQPSWPQPQLLRMPAPPPQPGAVAETDVAALLAATSEPTPQERFMQQAEAEQRAKPPQSFPFAVGDRPETAGPVDLGAWAKGETPKTMTLANEERRPRQEWSSAGTKSGREAGEPGALAHVARGDLYRVRGGARGRHCGGRIQGAAQRPVPGGAGDYHAGADDHAGGGDDAGDAGGQDQRRGQGWQGAEHRGLPEWEGRG